jgi:hypothetical protein
MIKKNNKFKFLSLFRTSKVLENALILAFCIFSWRLQIVHYCLLKANTTVNTCIHPFCCTSTICGTVIVDPTLFKFSHVTVPLSSCCHFHSPHETKLSKLLGFFQEENLTTTTDRSYGSNQSCLVHRSYL